HGGWPTQGIPTSSGNPGLRCGTPSEFDAPLKRRDCVFSSLSTVGVSCLLVLAFVYSANHVTRPPQPPLAKGGNYDCDLTRPSAALPVAQSIRKHTSTPQRTRSSCRRRGGANAKRAGVRATVRRRARSAGRRRDRSPGPPPVPIAGRGTSSAAAP